MRSCRATKYRYIRPWMPVFSVGRNQYRKLNSPARARVVWRGIVVLGNKYLSREVLLGAPCPCLGLDPAMRWKNSLQDGATMNYCKIRILHENARYVSKYDDLSPETCMLAATKESSRSNVIAPRQSYSMESTSRYQSSY